MNAMTPNLKSFDKNYLFGLLQGNTEMMGVVINEIQHTLPRCISEIELSIQKNDHLGVITFAARAKSAFYMLREDRLANSFQKIEDCARKGEMSRVKDLFTAELNQTADKPELFQKTV